MRLISRILAVGALLALAGCHFAREDACSKKVHYLAAGSVPPLKVPEGLPPANTKNALKIPDASAEARPRKATDACLDQSPSFYPDRPKPKPAEKS